MDLLSFPILYFMTFLSLFLFLSSSQDALHKITKIPPSAQNLFYGNSSIPLRSTVTLHDLGIDSSGHSLTLSINSSTSTNSYFVLKPVTPLVEDECTQLLADVTTGLKQHRAPAKTDVLDCTGGVYFFRSASGKKLAVFKPHDEEQGMPNNPKVKMISTIPHHTIHPHSFNPFSFDQLPNSRATKEPVNMVYVNISNLALDVCVKEQRI